MAPRRIPPSNLPSTRLQPSTKVITQRQYRGREGECFATLRGIIKRLTGEEPQTRYDILSKATDLLRVILADKIGRQELETQVPPVDLAVQSYFAQPWQIPEFDVETCYNQGASFEQADFDEMGATSYDDWSNDQLYRQ